MNGALTVESVKEVLRQVVDLAIHPTKLYVGQAAYEMAKAAKSPPKTGNPLADAQWEYLWHSIHRGKQA